MSSSPLVVYAKFSPNHSGRRNHKIDTITIHCMAGNLSIESCGAGFADPARRASSNYGIGSDGRIAMYVDEDNRSWCTSDAANDNRAITIEVANIENREPFRITDAAYAALIDLLEDICRRHGIPELRWRADKSLIGQVDKQNMTVHRWFAPKSCPGEWLYQHHGQIADEVNARLKKKEEELDMTKDELLSVKGTGDTPSSWAKDATDWAKAVGIFNGDGNGNYGWQQPITREALAQVLYNFRRMLSF